MEDTPNHDKKKNKNTNFQVTINLGAGAGAGGIGGIVLVGGALVTATIVSVLAFKTRRQRRSSPENSPSLSLLPSPEIQTVDAPNQLELMMKSNKDFSADSLPLDLQNSSDEVTCMKEMNTKNIQNLTQDEKGNSGIDYDEQVESGDSYKDTIFSVVGEDQESTLIFVESVFESRDVDCEEQVVMVDQIEEQKQLMLIDNENDDEHVDVIDEAVTSIEEEYEAIEGVDQVPFEDGEKDQETVFMNEEDKPQLQILEDEKEKDGDCDDEIIMENCEGDLIDEIGDSDEIVSERVIEEEEKAIDANCVNQVVVQNGPQVQFLEEEEEKQNDCQFEIVIKNCDNLDLVNQIIREESQQMQNKNEQVTEQEDEEAIKVDCFNNMEDVLKMVDHEVAVNDQYLHLNENHSSTVAIDDQTVAKEDNPLTELMNKEEIHEETVEMIKENELVKKDEIPHLGLIEDELVKEDEIPHVQSIEDEDVTVKNGVISDELQDSCTQEEVKPETNIDNKKIEEKMEENQTILGKEKNENGSKNGLMFVMNLAKGKKQALASDSRNLKLLTWTILVSIWCLFHWYSELPFPEISFVGSLLFILILLGYQNRTTYLVKYE